MQEPSRWPSGLPIACPACGASQLEPVIDLGTPVVSIVSFSEDIETARHAPRGPLRLIACSACALMISVDFDPERVRYDSSYDNSLHFSATFQHYAAGLAGRLAATYELRGGHVLEIGSGRGDFLRMLCGAAGATGSGYDPSFQEPGEPGDPVRLEAGYYPLDGTGEPFDFAVARHVLEHLADPLTLVSSLGQSARDGAHVYVEVPNAEFVLTSAGMWDVIYEHVLYFSPTSIHHLLTRAGLRIVEWGNSYDGQFLYAEAAQGADRTRPSIARPDPSEHLATVRAFGKLYRDTVDGWTARLGEARGGRAALWGAGAKGATFLNTVDSSAIDLVVDVNPRKWNRFVPGTGHRIVPPDGLRGTDVDTVLITNAAYQAEIAAQLDRMGLEAEVVAV